VSYTGTDAWGQGSSGLKETQGETALGEPGTEPDDYGLSMKVQVSDDGILTTLTHEQESLLRTVRFRGKATQRTVFATPKGNMTPFPRSSKNLSAGAKNGTGGRKRSEPEGYFAPRKTCHLTSFSGIVREDT
jgi:hypothetical protein